MLSQDEIIIYQLSSHLLVSMDNSGIWLDSLDCYEKKVVVHGLETLDDSVTHVVEVKLQEKNKIEKGEGGSEN